MDSGSSGHSTSIWSRLGQLFTHDPEETLERAILDARREGEVEPEESSMLLGILRFDDLKVQDTMTPRADIDCVADDMPLREVAEAVLTSGHSRLPVYRDNRDNIVGVVHAKDLLTCFADTSRLDTPVASIMRDPFFVPETKRVSSLLQEFRSRKQHIAIALDEYGGTSGLITIEDVLEEIVGEIEDEHDKPAKDEIRSMGDGLYELSSRVYLEDLAEVGPDIKSEDVDTIGGYLTMEAGHVPVIGEVFTHKGWTFTVLDADKKHIKLLSMKKAVQETAGDAPGTAGNQD